MDAVSQDFRYGVRQLARSRGMTMAAVVCIALGVAANTTIFSLVNSMLLRPIPGIAEPDRLVDVGRGHPQAPDMMDTFGYPNWADLRQNNDTLEDMAAWTLRPLALSGEGEPEVILGMEVSGSYFSVLGLQPAFGGFFTGGEVPVPGAPSVVVLSHGLWQRRFGSDPGIVGQTVRINGHPTAVVGVAPAGFAGHASILAFEAWVPLGMAAPGLADENTLASRRSNFLLSVGRLKDGVTLSEARANVALVYEQIVEAHPEIGEQIAALAPFGPMPSAMRGPIVLFMTVLMVVVGLVLLIACVNVASMLLARGMTRRKEVAVRLAMGASRGRLIRQLLTESLLLFLLGGSIGVLLAIWTTSLLGALEPPVPEPFNLAFDLSLDQRVLGFSLLLTLVTGVAFGLGPAFRASRPELVPALKEEVGIGRVRRTRVRGFLVAGQMAMALLLLMGAGLLLRALRTAQTIDPGFRPDRVVTMTLDLQLHGYEEEDGKQFYAELRQRLDELPGVEVASVAALLPLGLPSRMGFGGVNVEGFEPPPNDSSHDADVNIISPGYFRTLQIPLVMGRDFDERDVEGSIEAAIINETMANYFWPDGDAVGKQFLMGRFEDGTPYQVIGVARDSKYSSLGPETPFFTYLPLQQVYRSRMSLQVRTRGDAAASVAAIRGVVERLDRELPFLEVMPLSDYVDVIYLPQRVAGAVSGILGAIGLLLAAVGIYGVTAYAVNQRSQEIGVRMALGSRQGDVLRLVVQQGMFAPALGMLVGVGLALVMTRFLGSFLFGISALDPVTFVSVALLLGSVALIANLVPARRASRVDPVVALRSSE